MAIYIYLDIFHRNALNSNSENSISGQDLPHELDEWRELDPDIDNNGNNLTGILVKDGCWHRILLFNREESLD